MRTCSLLLAILVACFWAAPFGPCPPDGLGHGARTSLGRSRPDGDRPDTPTRPLRKAALGDESDRSEKEAGRPHHVSGGVLAAGSPQWAGGMSGLWPDLPAGRDSYPAPLYLVLRTLLI